MAVARYLTGTAQLAFWGKLLNIRSTEWRRVSLAWLLAFLYRGGFVVGWTILVAMFVSKYGITALPYLFVLHAVFSVLGSTCYSVFIDRFKRRHLMVFSLLMAAVLLGVAVYIAEINIALFFAFSIVAEAIFLMQFRILLSGFFEEMFTPLESVRTFPIIESAETLGGIFGSIIIISLSANFYMPDFGLFWIALILFSIPIILLSGRALDDLAFFKTKDIAKRRAAGIFTKIKTEFRKAKQYSFLRNLMVVVLLQWLLFNLLEFQYTKVVYSNVSDVILDSGSGLEHMLVHDLGLLFMTFCFSSLILQLFIAGRLINNLGVVGSMLLHPLITIFSLFGFTVSFNFFTAVLARNNFMMSSVLFNNTYHGSYYAVSEKLRGHTREVLEGMVRPMGALLGTLILIFLQYVFRDSALVFSVNLAMLFVALLMLFVLYFQQKNYTAVAVSELLSGSDVHARITAVMILSQKGHVGSLDPMLSVLLNEKEPPFLRVKILRALGELCPIVAIPSILKVFKSSSSLVKEAAVDLLMRYSKLKKFSQNHIFLGYDILEALKGLYASEGDRHVRLKIISIIARMSSVAALEHLLKLLKSTRGDFKADVISALGKFDDDLVFDYVSPYLSSKNLLQRVNAAIVLSKFEQSHEIAMHTIFDLMHSSSPKRLELAFYAIGELSVFSKKKFLLKHLSVKNVRVRLSAAIALAKMECDESVNVLIEIMLLADDALLKEIKHMLQNVNVRIRRNLDNMVKHLVSTEILSMMDENRGMSLYSLSPPTLKKLRKLYILVDEYNEVDRIDAISNNT